MDLNVPVGLDDLESCIKDNNEESIIIELNKIASIKNGVIEKTEPFELLLNKTEVSILIITTKTIAELAKTVPNRTLFSEPKLVLSILNLLKNKNTKLEIQTCRALGNLCYESDFVRNILFENKGLETIIEILRFELEDKKQDEMTADAEHYLINEHSKQLRTVACGLLFNFLASNENIQKKALEFDCLNVVEKLLKVESQNIDNSEDCITHLLLILTLLMDNGGEVWITENICKSLINILRLSTNPDISELCLEILQGQAEHDEIKLHLAKHGLCELMYVLLDKHKDLAQDEESRALMKMACDLIVLVLTGDESMNFLYHDGNGEVYYNMLNWLKSDDEDLLTTGILAIGNFARNDDHCIQMVQYGVPKMLFDVLRKHSSMDGDIKIPHAILSALKNLVIPVQNKSLLINEGVVDIIYPLMESEHTPVIFKLLGTLRMVIDGQKDTATELLLRKGFLEKLVYWCYNTDHGGVKGESSRLLAWSIKNCHSNMPYTNILKQPGTIKCLIDMIPSQHAVMQNEALLALNLIVLHCLSISENSPKDESGRSIDQKSILEDILIESKLGTNIFLLLEKYSKVIEPEVMENLCTFLEQITVNENMKEHLRQNNIVVELSKLKDNEKLVKLSDRFDKLESNIMSD